DGSRTCYVENCYWSNKKVLKFPSDLKEAVALSSRVVGRTENY
ncbi:10811_t:CDS:1, partial [Gigaspora rosea]